MSDDEHGGQDGMHSGFTSPQGKRGSGGDKAGARAAPPRPSLPASSPRESWGGGCERSDARADRADRISRGLHRGPSAGCWAAGALSRVSPGPGLFPGPRRTGPGPGPPSPHCVSVTGVRRPGRRRGWRRDVGEARAASPGGQGRWRGAGLRGGSPGRGGRTPSWFAALYPGLAGDGGTELRMTPSRFGPRGAVTGCDSDGGGTRIPRSARAGGLRCTRSAACDRGGARWVAVWPEHPVGQEHPAVHQRSFSSR